MSDNKDLILETAFRFFFEKGYKSVTMSELVKETGLSKGAFYHHFSSKEELYKEATEKYLISYFDKVPFVYKPELSLRENLKSIALDFSSLTEEFKQSIHHDDPGLSVYLLYIQTALNNREFKRKLEVYFLKILKILEGWFREAQARNEIKKNLDPNVLAKHISALMEGLYILDSFDMNKDSLADNFEKILNQLFDQIEIKS